MVYFIIKYSVILVMKIIICQWLRIHSLVFIRMTLIYLLIERGKIIDVLSMMSNKAVWCVRAVFLLSNLEILIYVLSAKRLLSWWLSMLKRKRLCLIVVISVYLIVHASILDLLLIILINNKLLASLFVYSVIVKMRR